MRRQMSLSAFHKVQEPAAQFTDARCLAKVYRFLGNQFTADADRDRSSENQFGCALLIDAAGSNQGNVRKHDVQRRNVGRTTQLGARHDFDKIRVCLPGADYLRRSQCARDHDHIAFRCEFVDRRMKSVTC